MLDTEAKPVGASEDAVPLLRNWELDPGASAAIVKRLE
jgi:hypothetical protein